MPQVKPKIPGELKDLAKFLQDRGYTLAIPFDNIRGPGYIGTYNADGQEVIVDTGKCLKDFVNPVSGKAVLGNYKKSSKFSIKGFLKIFGEIFGLDFEFLKVKNVSISFPNQIIKTDFITLIDIEEDWAKISPVCTKKLADPGNFLIVQVLVTDAISYSYSVGKKLDANSKLNLEKVVAAAAKAGKYEATVSFQSDVAFDIVVKDVPLSVGYKTARVTVQPITP
jgi:hypothetical protein